MSAATGGAGKPAAAKSSKSKGKTSKGGKGTDGKLVTGAGAAAKYSASEKDEHGFVVDSRIIAEYRGQKRPALVIDRATKNGMLPQKSQKAAGAASAAETAPAADADPILRYYVHFLQFNRRMDSWVTADKVEPIENDPDAVAISLAYGSGHGHGQGEEAATMASSGSKRGKKSSVVMFVEEKHGDMDEKDLVEHEKVTRVKNVNFLELGKYRMETWYFSPYPPEIYLPEGMIETLYVNEFSLQFFKHRSEMLNHSKKYPLRHPPGDEIYRKDGMAVWEVDGAKEKEYCQNLCYLAKLFLDHKTLYYDVDPFLFYIITELDEHGYHMVGYYSKEKESELGYNLACILCLPCYQRRGFGRFIIQFSYELSKKEKKVGSPEKPLSDLGQLGYRSYWSWQLLGILSNTSAPEISIMDLVAQTSILPEDVVETLQYHDFIRYMNGQHVMCLDPKVVKKKFDKYNNKPGPVVDPDYLHWTPLTISLKKDKWHIASKLRGSAAAQGTGT